MTDRTSRTYHWFEWLLMLGLAAITAYVYRGFYYPDAYFLQRAGAIYTIILWALRIGIPVVFITGVLLYHLVKTGRVSGANVGLAAGSIIVCGVLGYPAAGFVYNLAMDNESKLGAYHPYLQIAPNTFREAPQATPESYRIMCLGGSTTEWSDLETGRGWPLRVEKRLRNAYGQDQVFVYNQGRQWYTTLHTMINFQTNLRHHQPDLIIVMHALNDLLMNADFGYFCNGPFRQDYGHFYGSVNELVRRGGIEKFLWKKFRLYWYNTPREVVTQDSFPGLAVFERNLHTLIDLAQARGIDVVLMTQPNILKKEMSKEEQEILYMVNHEAIGPQKKWHYLSATNGIRQYNQRVREIARQRGVLLIDLVTAVPRELPYFKDEIHYESKTYDLLADYISQALMDSRLIAAKVEPEGSR